MKSFRNLRREKIPRAVALSIIFFHAASCVQPVGYSSIKTQRALDLRANRAPSLFVMPDGKNEIFSRKPDLSPEKTTFDGKSIPPNRSELRKEEIIKLDSRWGVKAQGSDGRLLEGDSHQTQLIECLKRARIYWPSVALRGVRVEAENDAEWIEPDLDNAVLRIGIGGFKSPEFLRWTVFRQLSEIHLDQQIAAYSRSFSSDSINSSRNRHFKLQTQSPHVIPLFRKALINKRMIDLLETFFSEEEKIKLTGEIKDPQTVSLLKQAGTISAPKTDYFSRAVLAISGEASSNFPSVFEDVDGSYKRRQLLDLVSYQAMEKTYGNDVEYQSVKSKMTVILTGLAFILMIVNRDDFGLYPDLERTLDVILILKHWEQRFPLPQWRTLKWFDDETLEILSRRHPKETELFFKFLGSSEPAVFLIGKMTPEVRKNFILNFFSEFKEEINVPDTALKGFYNQETLSAYEAVYTGLVELFGETVLENWIKDQPLRLMRSLRDLGSSGVEGVPKEMRIVSRAIGKVESVIPEESREGFLRRHFEGIINSREFLARKSLDLSKGIDSLKRLFPPEFIQNHLSESLDLWELALLIQDGTALEEKSLIALFRSFGADNMAALYLQNPEEFTGKLILLSSMSPSLLKRLDGTLFFDMVRRTSLSAFVSIWGDWLGTYFSYRGYVLQAINYTDIEPFDYFRGLEGGKYFYPEAKAELPRKLLDSVAAILEKRFPWMDDSTLRELFYQKPQSLAQMLVESVRMAFNKKAFRGKIAGDLDDVNFLGCMFKDPRSRKSTEWNAAVQSIVESDRSFIGLVHERMSDQYWRKLSTTSTDRLVRFYRELDPTLSPKEIAIRLMFDEQFDGVGADTRKRTLGRMDVLKEMFGEKGVDDVIKNAPKNFVSKETVLDPLRKALGPVFQKMWGGDWDHQFSQERADWFLRFYRAPHAHEIAKRKAEGGPESAPGSWLMDLLDNKQFPDVSEVLLVGLKSSPEAVTQALMDSRIIKKLKVLISIFGRESLEGVLRSSSAGIFLERVTAIELDGLEVSTNEAKAACALTISDTQGLFRQNPAGTLSFLNDWSKKNPDERAKIGDNFKRWGLENSEGLSLFKQTISGIELLVNVSKEPSSAGVLFDKAFFEKSVFPVVRELTRDATRGGWSVTSRLDEVKIMTELYERGEGEDPKMLLDLWIWLLDRMSLFVDRKGIDMEQDIRDYLPLQAFLRKIVEEKNTDDPLLEQALKVLVQMPALFKEIINKVDASKKAWIEERTPEIWARRYYDGLRYSISNKRKASILQDFFISGLLAELVGKDGLFDSHFHHAFAETLNDEDLDGLWAKDRQQATVAGVRQSLEGLIPSLMASNQAILDFLPPSLILRMVIYSQDGFLFFPKEKLLSGFVAKRPDFLKRIEGLIIQALSEGGRYHLEYKDALRFLLHLDNAPEQIQLLMSKLNKAGQRNLNGDLVNAFLANEFNRILIPHADLILGHESGTGLVSLKSKLGVARAFPTAENLRKELRAKGLDLEERDFESFVDPFLYTLWFGVVIPRISILETGYRGARSLDDFDARFFTRAVTVAARYAEGGGEFARAAGDRVIHQWDIHALTEMISKMKLEEGASLNITLRGTNINCSLLFSAGKLILKNPKGETLSTIVPPVEGTVMTIHMPGHTYRHMPVVFQIGRRGDEIYALMIDKFVALANYLDQSSDNRAYVRQVSMEGRADLEAIRDLVRAQVLERRLKQELVFAVDLLRQSDGEELISWALNILEKTLGDLEPDDLGKSKRLNARLERPYFDYAFGPLKSVLETKGLGASLLSLKEKVLSSSTVQAIEAERDGLADTFEAYDRRFYLDRYHGGLEGARILRNLFLRLLADDPESGKTVRRLYDDGDLDYFLREITSLRGVAQNSFHQGVQADEHSIRVLEAMDTVLRNPELSPKAASPMELRLLALLHDVGKVAGSGGHTQRSVVAVENFLKSVDAPNSMISRLKQLIQLHHVMGNIAAHTVRRLNTGREKETQTEAYRQKRDEQIQKLAQALLVDTDRKDALRKLNDLYLLSISDASAIPFKGSDTGNRYSTIFATYLSGVYADVAAAMEKQSSSQRSELRHSARDSSKLEVVVLVDGDSLLYRPEAEIRELVSLAKEDPARTVIVYNFGGEEAWARRLKAFGLPNIKFKNEGRIQTIQRLPRKNGKTLEVIECFSEEGQDGVAAREQFSDSQRQVHSVRQVVGKAGSLSYVIRHLGALRLSKPVDDVIQQAGVWIVGDAASSRMSVLQEGILAISFAVSA